MEARSYLENIANRTAMRAVIATMTKLLLVATFLVFGSVALVVTAELINDWRLVVAVVLGFAAAALLFLNVRELLRD